MEELRGDNRPAASLKQSKHRILYVVQIIKNPCFLHSPSLLYHTHRLTEGPRLRLRWRNALSPPPPPPPLISTLFEGAVEDERMKEFMKQNENANLFSAHKHFKTNQMSQDESQRPSTPPLTPHPNPLTPPCVISKCRHHRNFHFYFFFNFLFLNGFIREGMCTVSICPGEGGGRGAGWVRT